MDAKLKEKFATYPDTVYPALLQIRKIILDLGDKNDIGNIVETLKWGEPAYTVKGGSTIRIDWKAKYPEQYFVYFNCKTHLVETFRELYGDLFSYEGKRAIVFQRVDKIPQMELEHCISLALRYHRIKHLPLLGA